MKMPPFRLHIPTSIDEAIEIAKHMHSNEEEFDWVAGGTDSVSYTHLTLPTIRSV